jgi:hypothetical protein
MEIFLCGKAKMSCAAYRSVLRAARIAFAKDEYALQCARKRIREAFDAPLRRNQTVEKQIGVANDVARMLVRNVVQADMVNHDQQVIFKVKLDRDRHEFGDNKDRFNPIPTKGGVRNKCCSE